MCVMCGVIFSEDATKKYCCSLKNAWERAEKVFSLSLCVCVSPDIFVLQQENVKCNCTRESLTTFPVCHGHIIGGFPCLRAFRMSVWWQDMHLKTRMSAEPVPFINISAKHCVYEHQMFTCSCSCPVTWKQTCSDISVMIRHLSCDIFDSAKLSIVIR